jgi:flagellar protein FlaG
MEVKPASISTGVTGIDVNTVLGPAPPAQKNEGAPETSSGGSVTPEQINQMTKAIEARLGPTSISLNFTPYGNNNEKMAVVVSDKQSGEVIREIPPKELQDLYVKIDELIGTMLNHRI